MSRSVLIASIILGLFLVSVHVTGFQTLGLFVDDNGFVGIGSNSPASELHVADDDSKITISLEDTSSGNRWQVIHDTSGLSLALSGTGLREFQVDGAGRIATNCPNPSNGLVISDSTSNNCNLGTRSVMDPGDTTFTVASSRTFKENLAEVHVDGLLEKIRDIDVYSYDYINGPKDRIGLMAEDFHQIFGRGSDKMLSGQDVQVALWLAVRELIQQNRQLKRDVEQLRAER